MQAILEGYVIADSEDVIECGGYYYFAPASVQIAWLERAERTEDDLACPHGVQFYDVVIEGVRHPRAAWSYQSPRPAMQHVGGRFGFWQEVEVR